MIFNPEKHYYGSDCRKGHGGIRYINSGHCVKCMRKVTSQWSKNNRDRYNELQRNWSVKNPGKRAETVNNWRKNNPDKVKTYDRKRYHRRKNDPSFKAYQRFYVATRKADKEVATPMWADEDEMKYIYSLAREKGLEVDHLVPLKSDNVCGLHCGDNMRVIPKELNNYKNNRYWPDMWEYDQCCL